MKNNKNTYFIMRTNRTDKATIARLAKRLGVKQSQAVRRAVALMLQTTEQSHNPSPAPAQNMAV